MLGGVKNPKDINSGAILQTVRNWLLVGKEHRPFYKRLQGLLGPKKKPPIFLPACFRWEARVCLDTPPFPCGQGRIHQVVAQHALGAYEGLCDFLPETAELGLHRLLRTHRLEFRRAASFFGLGRGGCLLGAKETNPSLVGKGRKKSPNPGWASPKTRLICHILKGNGDCGLIGCFMSWPIRPAIILSSG